MLHSDFYENHIKYEFERAFYERTKTALQEEIAVEMEKLDNWLKENDNRKKAHYDIVETLFKNFQQKDRDFYSTLEFYEGKRDDLVAVNDALEGKNVHALVDRAEANMESRSEGLEVTGKVLALLAVTLLITAVCILNPWVLIAGGVAALSAFISYDIGSTKVSSNKSTLFNSLKESISPSPVREPLEEPQLMPFADAHLLYTRYW